jgi:pilus assembly protein FimV
MSAISDDSEESAASEESTASEENAASEESADSLENDIAFDDVVSLDESGDLDSDLSLDDLDMSALDDAEASAENDKSEDKQEFVDTDIADLGVNLDSDSLDSESADAGALDTGALDAEPGADENAEIDIDAIKDHDHEELEELREKGATPVTFPPENSAYLEEDDHISLDLSEAVIDEPELSTEGIDEPLTEPSLDMDSIDDLGITGDDSDAASEDISLADDSFADVSSPEESSPDESSIDELDIDIDMPLDEIKEGGQDLPVDEHVIPEGFEAELQETPAPPDEGIEDISFDDSLEAAEPADVDIPEEAAPPDESIESESIDKIEDIGELGDISDIEEIADIDETPEPVKTASAPPQTPSEPAQKDGNFQLPSALKKELKNILSYMDQLLESLPEEKIEEFAKSEYFDSYKKLFKELGLV